MSTQRYKSLLLGTAALSVSASIAAAEVPNVVTDIAPVASLAARVMDGLGTPQQIVQPGASPHGYAMRPSEAEALSGADAIFWIGPELTPWLDRTIHTVAPNADVTELLHAPETFVLAFRSGASFAEEGEAHDGHEDHSEHVDEADENGHDHEHEADDTHESDEGHAGHDHSGDDPHAWLDPENGKAWLGVIAGKLSQLDPENAEVYAANAAEGRAEIDAAAAEVETLLAPVADARIVVFHDAYHYFEHRFDLHAVGAIAASDASDPGPARIEEVRGVIEDMNVTCVLSEPAFNPAFVDTVTEGVSLRKGVIDPLGADLEPGPQFYPELIRDVARRLAACAG
ncbi:zinc ABC transporter substrate-binding protein [Roseovarius sp. S1116L3]|uniref:zinc ABC transporter substrate-binding protein n=1 Tax=Roseovarius roseus TaxID=3342636 RepID=UPI003729FFEF